MPSYWSAMAPLSKKLQPSVNAALVEIIHAPATHLVYALIVRWAIEVPQELLEAASYNRRMNRSALCSTVCAALLAVAVRSALAAGPSTAPSLATQANPMTLVLDARGAPRGLMHARLTIPARAGSFTLVYPKWIPGEHSPSGPLGDLAALTIEANGQSLAWHRDPINLYAFHVDVPAQTSSIDVEFDVLVNAPDDTMSTPNLAVINWNRDVLYQAETNVSDVFVKPSIVLPDGWDFGTALADPKRSGNRIDFAETTLATLVDSPLDCGRYAKHVVLWQGGGTQQVLDAFADRPQDLDFPPALINPYKNMTSEALAMYGARHWNVYHSLLTLSDAIGFEGIEHHQSSDDRASADYMTEAGEQLSDGDLLTHEFSHSWNGKYRRPADLTTPNYQVPMQTDLLWVYEGMNQYLGDVLSFRTGIRRAKLFPELLADVYARLDAEPGRLTKPLIDTTTAAPYLYMTVGDYPSIRRTAGDFYAEGELLWLDVDTIIREQSGGKRSLDDFLHRYAGPPDTGPMVVTYTREQIEALLRDVAPYDWHGFFQRYVYEIAPHPPTDELARAGWRLVYTSKPNEFAAAESKRRHTVDAWYSLGITMGSKGTIRDVRESSAAWSAGLSPGMKLVAVNGQKYDGDVLDYALRSAQSDNRPIALLTSHDGWYRTYDVNYRGGPRFPHLERIAGKPDMLARIAAPHRK